jgi:hypothetical protein
MRGTAGHRIASLSEGAAEGQASAVMSTSARQQRVSFGEIAKLCADRGNRTILENEAWKTREWAALGKLFEALLNGKLGAVRIRSHGMTEKDAIKQSGSVANLLKERFEEWLGFKFRSIGGSISAPPEWGKVVSTPEAQALADAYLRPCCISKTAVASWLKSQNIDANKTSKARVGNIRSKSRGRPRVTQQLELAKKLLINMRQDPEGTMKALGIRPRQNITKIKIARLIAEQVQQKQHGKIAAKTIINQLGAELVLTVDALK